jgi:hypothetical protein
MMLPLMLAAAHALTPDQFSQPLDVAQPVRLQMTPTLDGTISKEEWDPFGPQTYLQWEPGKLYIAGEMPAGKDLVLSIDGKADGWLIGRDNIEFRVSMRNGKPEIVVRELDATAVRQPTWRDRSDLAAASTAQATTNGGTTTIEACFSDAGLGVLPRSPQDVSLRLDAADPSTEATSYLPRVCSQVRLDDRRAIALPKGLIYAVETRNRTVASGDDISLRLTFQGSNQLGTKNIEMRGLGDAESATNRMSVIFPAFDVKGRAFVDYATRVDPSASIGYRVVHGSISFKDGPVAVVESSYRIAPPLDFSLRRTNWDRLPDNNILRISYQLQLYTLRGADGLVHIDPPKGWEVLKGDGSKFALLGNQSGEVRQMELKVPADAHGTFEVKLTAEMKSRSISQVCYVTIR